MSIENGRDIAELFRRVNNLIRIGKVAEVDYTSARARVQIGKNTTAFLPWLVPSTATWFPLKNGEQVVVLSPNGDLGMAVILPALYQSTKPAPSKDEKKVVIVADIEQTGSKIMTGSLHVEKDISTESNINADANMNSGGDIVASGEVIGKGVELSTHSHPFQYVGAGQGATPQSGATQKPS
jgi:phage baseplate assembly protein gpV